MQSKIKSVDKVKFPLSDVECFLSKVIHLVVFGRENLSVERHKFSVWVKQRQMSPPKRPPFLKCSLYQRPSFDNRAPFN
jgi:hypothetical protein